MGTPAQVSANQDNAQLSTGPSTPEGKSTSSRNAVKHGLSGGFIVFPHEDQQAFDRLIDNYRKELSPHSEHETFLVEEMAQARWKLARMRRLESALVERLTCPGDSDLSPDAIVVSSMLASKTDAFAALQRYSAAAQRAYHRAYKELKDGRASREKADIAAMDSMLTRTFTSQPTLPAKPAVQNEPNRPQAVSNPTAASLGNLALRL
jgi:hypothetical protein